MTNAQFEIDVGLSELVSYAALSGDQNPLHVDQAYAKRTSFGSQVLHGTYSAGLISRLAGMQLPGSGCLLHFMRLNFVAPILPPIRLVVAGRQVSGDSDKGRVDATISDARTGRSYVEASYEFSRVGDEPTPITDSTPSATLAAGPKKSVVLISGASGGLGSALRSRLGASALGWSRSSSTGMRSAKSADELDGALDDREISAIVHCAWPMPDNRPLLDLVKPSISVAHHVAEPLTEVIVLAKLLARRGSPNAMLVLVGSTFADPGRHGYRMPLYSIAKSMIPTLARILALEFGETGMRSVAVIFDVLDGGMNRTLSRTTKLSHADRLPSGPLPTTAEAADQICWLLNNSGRLVSGATIVLSGGALP